VSATDVPIAAEAAGEARLDGVLPAKQEALVRHAYELFAAKGLQRVTIQDIADAAGVSKAIIVYYFKTKENLVLRTMEWVLARVATRITETVASVEGPEGKVRAMIDAIFVDARLNRTFYIPYAELIAHGARNNRFKELGATFRSIMNALYAEVIRSSSRELSTSAVDELAIGVRAIIDGFFLQWLSESDWEREHVRYKEMCTRAVLVYLGLAAPDDLPVGPQPTRRFSALRR
jgi:TetR/AcrR family transcriptional regulator, fatty acid metabolism regulator protein